MSKPKCPPGEVLINGKCCKPLGVKVSFVAGASCDPTEKRVKVVLPVPDPGPLMPGILKAFKGK